MRRKTRLHQNEINDVITQSSFDVSAMMETANKGVLDAKWNSLNQLYESYPFFSKIKPEFKKAQQYYQLMLNNAESWKTYIPTIIWYGIGNQYHFWLFGNGKDRHGVIRGDFGFSYIDSQPISEKIWSRVWISFTFTIISVLLAYLYQYSTWNFFSLQERLFFR